MKKQSEKKTMTKSIKLSQNEYEQIQKQAADKGMNFSKYIIDSAIHRQNTITPQIAVKVTGDSKYCIGFGRQVIL